jgi:hypothetical protein
MSPSQSKASGAPPPPPPAAQGGGGGQGSIPNGIKFLFGGEYIVYVVNKLINGTLDPREFVSEGNCWYNVELCCDY